jgi:hypothetical protein
MHVTSPLLKRICISLLCLANNGADYPMAGWTSRHPTSSTAEVATPRRSYPCSPSSFSIGCKAENRKFVALWCLTQCVAMALTSVVRSCDTERGRRQVTRQMGWIRWCTARANEEAREKTLIAIEKSLRKQCAARDEPKTRNSLLISLLHGLGTCNFRTLANCSSVIFLLLEHLSYPIIPE